MNCKLQLGRPISTFERKGYGCELPELHTDGHRHGLVAKARRPSLMPSHFSPGMAAVSSHSAFFNSMPSTKPAVVVLNFAIFNTG